MTTGERIRAARKRAHLTQAALGEKVGCTDAAIRHYENGIRTPGPEQIKAIAEALDVSVESLSEYNLYTVRDVVEVLLRMEESGFGVHPADGSIAVDPKAPHAKKLRQALDIWQSERDALASGEIAQDEYDDWRSSF